MTLADWFATSPTIARYRAAAARCAAAFTPAVIAHAAAGFEWPSVETCRTNEAAAGAVLARIENIYRIGDIYRLDIVNGIRAAHPGLTDNDLIRTMMINVDRAVTTWRTITHQWRHAITARELDPNSLGYVAARHGIGEAIDAEDSIITEPRGVLGIPDAPVTIRHPTMRLPRRRGRHARRNH